MMPPASTTSPWSSLSRAGLEKLRERWLCRAGPWKADLSLLRLGGERAVLKDFSAKSPLVRFIGRAQVAREESVYRRLGGLPGVPELLARPSPESLLIAFVEGRRLSKERGTTDAAQLAERLQALVEAIHGRGVAHVDLRGRDNILVDPARRLWVLDFGASWLRGQGGPVRRWIFNLGCFIDRAAVLKWRLLLAPERVDAGERSRHDSFRRLRRLWPFNLKRNPRVHVRPR